MLTRNLVLILVVASGGVFATKSHAQVFRFWKDPVTGAYSDQFKWNPSGVPNASDGAGFTKAGSYAVTFPFNQTTGIVTVSNGTVFFDLNTSGTARTLTVPGTLTVSGSGILAVLDGAVDPGSVLVSAGGQLLVDSTATVVNPDGTTSSTGGGSLLDIESAFTIGQSGTGTLLIEDGGSATSSSGTSTIGSSAGSDGTVTVTDAGSNWALSSGLRVGESGEGTLAIEAGAQVSNTFGVLGNSADSTGSVTVSGPGSTWSNSSSLNVGLFGSGTLLIDAGGSVSNAAPHIGRHSGSDGSATVTGAGSIWSSSGVLHVGDGGTGELTISDGGIVSSNSGSIGVQMNGAGTVTVTGNESTWTNTQDIIIGDAGNGTLTIEDGASVSDTRGMIGNLVDDGVTGTGNVTVTGAGSTWINSDSLTVGQFGDGTLAIENGGIVTASTLVLIGLDETISGMVTVSGSGSSLSSESGLSINNGSLAIADEGSVSNTISILGDTDDGVNFGVATVTVTGAGSTWTCSGQMNIGASGNGTVDVEAGGGVSSTSVILGALDGSTGSVTVTGSDSTWTASGDVVIGDKGTGTVRIEAGGTISEGTISIGEDGDGSVTISGTDSQWTTGSNLRIGTFNIGILNVQAGGLIQNSTGFIGAVSGSSGTVTVTGSGSTWVNTSSLHVGDMGDGVLNVADGGSVLTNFDAFVGQEPGSSGSVSVSSFSFQDPPSWTIGRQLSVGGDAFFGTNGGAGDLVIGNRGSVDVGEDTVLFADGEVRLSFGGEFSTTAISFDGGGVFDWAGGTLHVDQYNGDLLNQNGTLAPGVGAPTGNTLILGDYTQQAGGTLQFEFGGTGMGTTFDFVNVTGTAILDGVLELGLVDGFIPQPSNTFIVFNANALLGIFDNVANNQRLDTADGLGSFLVHYGVGSAFDEDQIVLTDFELACPADIDQSGAVDVSDLLALLAAWGDCPAPCPPACAADVNGDCQVNVSDLLALLAAWGGCP